jgi:hypothetical protein
MMMTKSLMLIFLAGTCPLGLMAQDVVSAVHGSVRKIDSATKVVVVKTDDGTEHTFHYAGDLVVHGSNASVKGTQDALHDISDGSEVAVHYTAVHGRETAHEIDRLGGDGLKVADGTVSHLDRAGRKVSIKTADGSEQSFDLTKRAAKDTDKDVVEGTDKTVHVSVYYTEDAGKKTVHFIKQSL